MKPQRKTQMIQWGVYAAILLLTFVLAGRYDILEELLVLSHQYEAFELDELFVVLIVAVLCLLVSVSRQYRAQAKAYQLIEKQKQQLEEAWSELKVLRGVVPICSYCKSIKGENGVWYRMEAYVEAHSEAQFSHGICEICVDKHFPGERQGIVEPV